MNRVAHSFNKGAFRFCLTYGQTTIISIVVCLPIDIKDILSIYNADYRNKEAFFFKKKNIWFSEAPFDVTGCDAVFFYACKNNVELPGFEKSEAPTMVIDLEQDLETIWGNMDKKSCRYFIKRADREGIEVKTNDHYDEFIRLYSKFVRQKGYRSWPMKIDTLRRYGTLFTAFHHGKIMAGIILVEDLSNIRWLLGGSRRLEVDKEKAVLMSCANRFLVWEAIKYAKGKGLKEFDLGGYYAGNDKNDPRYTINQFKKQFGGFLVTYYNYTKYYSRIYRLAKRVTKIIR